MKELPVDTDPEGGTWCVATWEDVDPDTDFLTIYVEGLTNAYRWLEEGEGQPAAEEFTYTEKVLQLNFWRPGDRYEERESEIHFGMPPEDVSRQGLNLNQLYGVPERVDYLWIYR